MLTTESLGEENVLTEQMPC